MTVFTESYNSTPNKSYGRVKSEYHTSIGVHGGERVRRREIALVVDIDSHTFLRISATNLDA